jgi:hypothetical protein
VTCHYKTFGSIPDQAMAFGFARKWLSGAVKAGIEFRRDSVLLDITTVGIRGFNQREVGNVTDAPVVNYLARLLLEPQSQAAGNPETNPDYWVAGNPETKPDYWVQLTFEYLNTNWNTVSESLKFQGKYLSVKSCWRVYFVTHAVLVATAYGTQPPTHLDIDSWDKIACLLRGWISAMHDQTKQQANLEVFYEACYVLLFMHRLHQTPTTVEQIKALGTTLVTARQRIIHWAEQGDPASILVQKKRPFTQDESNLFLVSASKTNNAMVADYHAHIILTIFLMEAEAHKFFDADDAPATVVQSCMLLSMPNLIERIRG